jgi:hypothetical protein
VEIVLIAVGQAWYCTAPFSAVLDGYNTVIISVAGLLPVWFKLLWPRKWHLVHTIVLIIVVLLQSQITSMDRTENVVLDIEGPPQQPDKCCTGSPKMTVCLLFHIISINIQ